jgi:glycerophosphoryl diester phosphodiesterase
MSSRANSGSSSPALDRISIDRPLVICHRGYGAVAPENTLVSFELGLDAGADLIELDYRHSQDGVPVVIHDSTFDRTTNSLEVWGRRRVRVASKTAEKIRALDAGSWFGARFAGVGVPLLTEALDFILAGGGVPLVEHKSGDAAASAKLLREGGWINRVVLMSFDWSFLREFHEIEPGQVLGALGPAVSLADGRRASRFSRNCGRGWLDELEKTGAGHRDLEPPGFEGRHPACALARAESLGLHRGPSKARGSVVRDRCGRDHHEQNCPDPTCAGHVLMFQKRQRAAAGPGCFRARPRPIAVHGPHARPIFLDPRLPTNRATIAAIVKRRRRALREGSANSHWRVHQPAALLPFGPDERRLGNRQPQDRQGI